MTPTKLKISRGPSLSFTGEMLAQDEWQANNGRTIKIEFYQTTGGALIGVRWSRGEWEDSFSESEAFVVEPNGDAQEMRFELLSWFNWELRAKALAKKLGWRLTREVA